jgi:hypothetical protein
MDDIVRQAMAKWPDVPDCYGWLGLDARGQWYMRDDRTQTLGPFASAAPGAKGSLLRHEKLVDFIHRNYERDGEGRWFFQNGPQRVYVELEATPWIWRLHDDGRVASHTGREAGEVSACLTDEAGRVYLLTEAGFGLVHSQDVALAADAIEQGRWSVQEVRAADLPAHYGYVMSPAGQQKAGHQG